MDITIASKEFKINICTNLEKGRIMFDFTKDPATIDDGETIEIDVENGIIDDRENIDEGETIEIDVENGIIDERETPPPTLSPIHDAQVIKFDKQQQLLKAPRKKEIFLCNEILRFNKPHRLIRKAKQIL